MSTYIWKNGNVLLFPVGLKELGQKTLPVLPAEQQSTNKSQKDVITLPFLSKTVTVSQPVSQLCVRTDSLKFLRVQTSTRSNNKSIVH